MEPLSRSGSPTLPEYTNSNPSAIASPPLARPNTPRPEGVDPANDFVIIPTDSHDDAVASAVHSLSRVRLSQSHQETGMVDFQTALRDAQELIASVRAQNEAYQKTKDVSQHDFFPVINVSYEHTFRFLQQAPSLISLIEDRTHNTCLHVGIKQIRDNPTNFIPLIVLYTVCLELGADRSQVNAHGQMPIELALELDPPIPLLVDLLSGDEFNKKTLIELAQRHNNPELIEWLTRDPPAVSSNTQSPVRNDNNSQEPSEAALRDARHLANELMSNPINVYQRVKELYLTHKELLTATFGNSGDTVMHRAVEAFAKNHILGIFELLVLLELKANKNATNYANKTPLDLAIEFNSIILVQLLEHPEPTLEVLTNLAIEHGSESLLNWTLN